MLCFFEVLAFCREPGAPDVSTSVMFHALLLGWLLGGSTPGTAALPTGTCREQKCFNQGWRREWLVDSRLALLISLLIEVPSEVGQTCCSSKRAHVGVCGEGHMELDTRLLQRDCAESLEAPLQAQIQAACSTQGSINPPKSFSHGGFFSRVNIGVIQKVRKHKMKDWPTSQGCRVCQKIRMLVLPSRWHFRLCGDREASGCHCIYP